MNDWAPVLEKFKTAKVLVVGDICLDRWCHYEPGESDISRETGIPRVGVVSTHVTPGAGGTVANNLASLGAGRVAVMGAIGQDGFGFELERALSQRHIDYHLLVASRKIQTFTYTKIINAQTGVEDRPRLDFINTTPLPEDVEDQLIAFFHREYANFDVILVADQAETRQGGVITNAFREVIVDVAERNPDKIMLADSRHRIERFRNTIAKPNLMEANAACNNLFGAVDFARLRSALGKKPLVITQGPKGVLLVTEDGEKHIPAVPVANPVDVCGAGDSFAAGMALALQATGDVEKAAHFGSLVSSITIMKKGTGTASPSEVIEKAESLRASA